ncbi:MAG: hypothetical protein WCK41_10470 [Actinomycetes bacterium]
MEPQPSPIAVNCDASASDMMLLCQKLGERMAADGAPHALAAAMTLAVRGLDGVDSYTFAKRTGIDHDALRRAEAGEVPFEELPAAIMNRAVAEPRLDVDWLRQSAS